MRKVPFGYVIEKGVAKINDEQAEMLRVLFDEYINCKSMRLAAKKAGIEKTHSCIRNLILNKTYLGTEFYPQIIDESTFNAAQELKRNNAIKQNRIRPHKEDKPLPTSFTFTLEKVKTKYDDPYKQAEYAYEQIKETTNE